MALKKVSVKKPLVDHHALAGKLSLVSCGIILSIDPSSTCSGWAIWTTHNECLASGCIKPKAKLPSWERIMIIVGELRKIADQCDHCVIEIPSGHTNAIYKNGKKITPSYLPIYGMCVGAVRLAMIGEFSEFEITVFDQNEWTSGEGGYGSKKNRQKRAALVYREYNPDNDKGMDESDAISLGHYFLQYKKLNDLRKRAL